MFRFLGADRWQGRLWAIIVGLFLIAIYVLAFVVRNDDRVEIDFVLFTATVSLIWVIVFVLALGLLSGVLLSQFYRRRAERRQALDGGDELRGRREAEGEPRG